MKAHLPSTDKPLLKAALGILIAIWGLFIVLFIGTRLPLVGAPLGGLVCWIGLEFFIFHRHQAQHPMPLPVQSKKRFWKFFT